jgi:predicted nuclease of restriction endonuclease-like RecB superfamily
MENNVRCKNSRRLLGKKSGNILMRINKIETKSTDKNIRELRRVANQELLQ